MKTLLILIMAIIGLESQAQKISLAATNVKVNIKDPQNKRRYKRGPTAPVCGYLSRADSTFYDCDGAVVEKVQDFSKLKDGDGCCSVINLSAGTIVVVGTLNVVKDEEVVIKNQKEEFRVFLNDSAAAKLKAEIDKKVIKDKGKVEMVIQL